MSEKFRVELSALTGYAEQLERNAGHVESARGYMAGPGSDTSEMQGLLSGIAEGYQPLVAWQLGILEKMASGLKRTGGALQESERVYRSHDDSASATLDRSYRGGSFENG
ncbi:hypothetical protein SAMN04487904_109108 [Actinopolyspora lacussalsi subsp. righensis]|uniref:Excreted virulence factor EspC, type VII ESX diderm n=3 Tax=Actinopolyspora TaxID=1849 RepID=A0A1G8VK62_ACTMZ|nr:MULTISPECIES: hypothetical protein [Actinopolyspora]SDJ66324.1 hypothetical protein SAMN04487820_101134 [Actinopolyspora mzabensis]SFD62814.1 hypothetical protein SAMN04487819_101402 [Actinopolyspora alba]SFT82068.1 hypothetical protein SAMN04487904_109108 [Actinopolyspora righensis]